MNHPYTDITDLKLTREDKVEWFRYERASHVAKWDYYRHRDFVERLLECVICAGNTYSLDAICIRCKQEMAVNNNRKKAS